MESEALKKMQEELKWVQFREKADVSFFEKLMSKGIFSLFVPAGCLVTSGILLTGLYQMIQKNSQKQQKLMRYRVAAQGVTLIIAVISILAVPLNQSN